MRRLKIRIDLVLSGDELGCGVIYGVFFAVFSECYLEDTLRDLTTASFFFTVAFRIPLVEDHLQKFAINTGF